jgi:HEAT repeat protein
MLKIVSDRSHGKSIEMVVIGLGKLKSDKSFNRLIELVSDGEISGHAIAALGLLGDVISVPVIEKMLNSDNLLVRREAKKSLRKILKRADN